MRRYAVFRLPPLLIKDTKADCLFIARYYSSAKLTLISAQTLGIFVASPYYQRNIIV